LAAARALGKRLARPGDSVTESNTLRDSVTGADREVDVVIEGDTRGNRLMSHPVPPIVIGMVLNITVISYVTP
jgi:hypothetical protein